MVLVFFGAVSRIGKVEANNYDNTGLFRFEVQENRVSPFATNIYMSSFDGYVSLKVH